MVPLHFGIQNAFSFSSLSFTFLSHNDAASVRRWMSARLRASDDLTTEEGAKRETKTESLFSPCLPPSSFPELNVCLLAKRRGVRVRGMRPSPHFPPRLRFSFLLTTRRRRCRAGSDESLGSNAFRVQEENEALPVPKAGSMTVPPPCAAVQNSRGVFS